MAVADGNDWLASWNDRKRLPRPPARAPSRTHAGETMGLASRLWAPPPTAAGRTLSGGLWERRRTLLHADKASSYEVNRLRSITVSQHPLDLGEMFIMRGGAGGKSRGGIHLHRK